MHTLQSIYKNKLVAVIRGATEEEIIPIAKALHEGGVNILEITAETPSVLSLLKRVSYEFGNEVTVGAGSVLDSETARNVIMAGAKFIFAPTVNVETIQMAKRYGVVSIPGAMTPTEILTAYEYGADIIKIFPAGVLGPKYVKDLHGPLPHIPLMPTGGVDLDNIREYFQNGAVAAGVGGSLVDAKKTIDKTALRELTKKAIQFREKIS
ncbi:bifunctional 4-hydroxy-2-oxoglutarate aldolase/2-dehydro-3-deoxy-phosphogluconate aldolase [Virgibacillus sp. NKC19-3]|uniref:bifunctional 4-hydroxy-2-oxoglutarate aldolase/2-dehydro-3-deoxy-phosphogluconate aldolase n=1 Tax=Virgibacillus saliphilus TaxID=2831674 RepID=UPI001C9AACDC|nr:bifunctional 4-hydroxy-2-oxoglutarate aldolase/2-dehydro-3-deoxy-phosphogluconate aldolase [Virgibacillus sp. NKC19-3]MBY7144209.1 bifunctional 4-hydroxy-2-oxoglutarate aldolase/2-dehydro-3-deoxy-phosphogluconate aldolase [Virgibacillus sp. NKC19-3]